VSSNLSHRLNNPGHIERRRDGKPEVWQGVAKFQPHGRFLAFESNVMGVRAIVVTLITYYDKRVARDGSRIDTLREVVARWAPATENNVGAYATHLGHLLDMDPDQPVNIKHPEIMFGLVKGIIRHENGRDCCSDDEIREGMRRAGIVAPPPPLTKSGAVQSQAVTTATVSAGGAVAAITAAAPAVPVLRDIADFAREYPVELAVVGGLVVLGCAIATLVSLLRARRRGLA
jgi:hypothetical protein